MAIDKQPSCDDVFEPELLPVGEAIERMAAQISPVEETIDLPIRQALGRIAASSIESPIDVPVSYTHLTLPTIYSV